MTQNPLISVVMPTYHSEKHLRESILSILNQTTKDFEFIIVADEPTSAEEKIIEKYRWRDKRIFPVYQDTRRGLVNSLNIGFSLAKGTYIARMDADDISLPDRFEKQVAFMDQNPEVGICGTGIINVVRGKEYKVPPKIDNASILTSTLISGCAISHPSVMFRTSFIKKIPGPYQERFKCAEDIDLWIRCIGKTAFHNIPDYLLVYKPDGTNVCSLNIGIQNEIMRAVREAIADAIYLPARGNLSLGDWLHLLYETNNQYHRIPHQQFNRVVAEEWHNYCLTRAYDLGYGAWRLFWDSPLSNYMPLTTKRKVKFLGACMLRKKFEAP